MFGARLFGAALWMALDERAGLRRAGNEPVTDSTVAIVNPAAMRRDFLRPVFSLRRSTERPPQVPRRAMKARAGGRRHDPLPVEYPLP
jgi:hypothetical protein